MRTVCPPGTCRECDRIWIIFLHLLADSQRRAAVSQLVINTSMSTPMSSAWMAMTDEAVNQWLR